jgi:cell division protein FtsN
MNFRIQYSFLIVLIIFFAGLFSSCCSDDQCSEEDTYGKTVVLETDTVYKKIPKYKISPLYIQIGAFVNRANAENFANSAREQLKMQVSLKLTQEGVFRVTVGEFNDVEKAKELLEYVKQHGYSDAFVRDDYGPIQK